MDEEIKISKDMLRTLSADTRANILKLLEERPMTASELSRATNKHVTTISEHINLMINSNLVERVERPGRKWVYYKLTKNASKIIHPTSYYKWTIVLSLSFFILAGSVYASSYAGPDSPLYGVKQFTESMKLAAAAEGNDKAIVQLDIANERLQEAKMAARSNSDEAIKNVIENYKDSVEKIEEEIGMAKSRSQETTTVLEKVSEETAKHISILENILITHPKYKEEINSALNASEKIHQKTKDELKEKIRIETG